MAEHGAGARTSLCNAPETNLYFFPTGEVRVCCLNQRPLGNIARSSLLELWNGANRREVADALNGGEWGRGCQSCARQATIEGRAMSYAAFFDTLPDIGPNDGWPIRMEFNLSNTCNLQCVQCSGDLSSSIRTQREKRAPLPQVYDDRFFEDLRSFIPHLRLAQFAGGEPFLASESYRVWDLVAELNPDLDCSVVTNATTWTPRVRDVVERLRMSFVFSIDGMTDETYRAIRIGADFAAVLENVERFRDVAARRGTATSINHCLMRGNYHEFGDLLLYAEERSMPVSVSVVRDPPHQSIATLPADELRRIHQFLVAQEPSVLPHLSINAEVWRSEVERIGRWSAADEDELHDAISVWATTVDMLGFPAYSAERTDEAALRQRLAEYATDGAVHTIELDESGVVVAIDPALCARIGTTAEHVVGATIDEVNERAFAALGDVTDSEVLERTECWMLVKVTYPDTSLLVTTLVHRDADGRTTTGRVLVALR